MTQYTDIASDGGFDPRNQFDATPPKPEWVGLTDEEIDEVQEVAYRSFRRHEMSARGQLIMPADSVDWHFARAVEAKLKEKNHG